MRSTKSQIFSWTFSPVFLVLCLVIVERNDGVVEEQKWQRQRDDDRQGDNENGANVGTAGTEDDVAAWPGTPSRRDGNNVPGQIPKPTHRPSPVELNDVRSVHGAHGGVSQQGQGADDAAASPTRRTPLRSSTVRSRVDPGIKSQVEWYDDTQYYALKASSDTRFRIRHAPIPEAGSPWPMPQLYQPYNVSFRISAANFEFHSVGEPCDLLEVNFRRIRRNIFGDADAEPSSSPGENGVPVDVRSLNVTVLKECTDYPYLEMDESYDLEIKRTGVSIITREVWGALRGMETFSQLVYQDKHGAFWVNKTYIHDYPRFKHRGILLDTSRHFLEKETILANLEAMAQNKMNVFHWHIVDDQSFPFESKVFPNLTKFGAYDPVTHIYTHKDIAEIIEEARIRGIRVIPEFDTPGHTFSWGYGQDHLLTPCYNYKREPSGLYGPVNPILKKTYNFLRSLFDEVLSVFKDKYVHLGGDEVPFDCWQSNPFLQSFMKRNNISDIKELLSLYSRELLKIVTDLGQNRNDGSGYIVWQEVFDNGVKLKPDTIVQIWSGDSYDVDRVTKSGLRALFSTCWYLDYINYGQDWDKYYRCEQVGSQLDDYRVHNQSLLIGGEACLWTEYADDDSVMPRLWPRASAAAERLWSDRHLVDVHQAAPRIEEQRCRMIRRGLHVGVLSGPGHCPRYGKVRKKSKKASEKFLIPVEFFAESKTAVDDERSYQRRSGGGSVAKNVYMVDMNTIYMAPPVVLVVIVVLALVVVIVFLQSSSSRSRILTLIGSFSLSSSAVLQRRRRLVLVFFVFAVVWFVWTAPIWMHSWETPTVETHARRRRR